jgi:hypothetical protein
MEQFMLINLGGVVLKSASGIEDLGSKPTKTMKIFGKTQQCFCV